MRFILLIKQRILTYVSNVAFRFFLVESRYLVSWIECSLYFVVSKLVLEAVLFWAIVNSRFCVHGFDVDNVIKQDWGVMLTLGYQFRFRWDLPIFVSTLYSYLVDLRRIKKVQLQRKSLFKLFSSWYFSIFPLTSSFCLVCTFASRCQQSTHPILFFWPQYFGFLYPIILFLRLHPTSLLQASCWPRFLQIFVCLISPLLKHNSKLLRILRHSLKCDSMRCTPLHSSPHPCCLSFSLLLFFLTCCATSSVVLPYYLFYSVLAMKWDYFHSLAVLRSQQFLYVEIPHTHSHTLLSTLSISSFVFSDSACAEPRMVLVMDPTTSHP